MRVCSRLLSTLLSEVFWPICPVSRLPGKWNCIVAAITSGLRLIRSYRHCAIFENCYLGLFLIPGVRAALASSSACLCLKISATSSNECTLSTSSSISSKEASIHWSISTHTLPWCLYKCASCPSLFMPFIAATTFTLKRRSCVCEFRCQRERCKPKS